MRRILAFVASLVIRLLGITWRVRLLGYDLDHSRPVVACFWHGDQAGMFAHPRPRPVVVLASLSRDGDLQTRILKHLGFRVVRGSSSRRGAVGLKALIAEIRLGADAAFAVDGPRGPRHEVKPGAVLAARRTGAALVPVSIRPSRAWVFDKAWDRYTLPKPFAEVRLYRGAPINADGGDLETVTAELERALLLVPAKK
jgi:lysophospholipid acyltransferase (LPLAT)-like uncharacterized protein